LAFPKESVFVEKIQPPTASVKITLYENMKLSRKQIIGIKNLVSAAVPKLVVENVKLVDENGEPLGEDDELSSAGELAKLQLKYKKNYEKLYEDKIVKMLAPFIGSIDKVVAKVSIEFDFSKKDSTEEVYDPNSVPRSEQTYEEKREGFKPKDVGGVPGAVSNIGPVQGLNNNNLKEKYEKAKTTTNYEISKKVSKIKSEFATIKRITAAVVVDGAYEYKTVNNEEKLTYIPKTKEELNSIAELVKQAIGASEARNDKVIVSNFRFKQEKEDIISLTPAEAFIKKIEMFTGPFYPFLKYLFLIIILFIFYKKIIVPFSNKMLELKVEEEEPKEVKIEFEDEEFENNLEKRNDMKKKIEQQLGISGEADEDSLRYDVILDKLKDTAEEKPEDIASILSQLIQEDVSKANTGKENKK
jgi:flagellar M-ring protein FliF